MMGVSGERGLGDTLATRRLQQHSSLACQSSEGSRGRAVLCHPHAKHHALPETLEPVVTYSFPLYTVSSLILPQRKICAFAPSSPDILSGVFIFIHLVLMNNEGFRRNGPHIPLAGLCFPGPAGESAMSRTCLLLSLGSCPSLTYPSTAHFDSSRTYTSSSHQ